MPKREIKKPPQMRPASSEGCGSLRAPRLGSWLPRSSRRRRFPDLSSAPTRSSASLPFPAAGSEARRAVRLGVLPLPLKLSPHHVPPQRAMSAVTSLLPLSASEPCGGRSTWSQVKMQRGRRRGWRRKRTCALTGRPPLAADARYRSSRRFCWDPP
jgi:hypothetical protein